MAVAWASSTVAPCSGRLGRGMPPRTGKPAVLRALGLGAPPPADVRGPRGCRAARRGASCTHSSVQRTGAGIAALAARWGHVDCGTSPRAPHPHGPAPSSLWGPCRNGRTHAVGLPLLGAGTGGMAPAGGGGGTPSPHAGCTVRVAGLPVFGRAAPAGPGARRQCAAAGKGPPVPPVRNVPSRARGA